MIDLSTRVTQIDPANAEAYSNLCGAKAVTGRLTEAEKDCSMAEQLDPDFSMTYNNRGVIFELRGDLIGAGELFHKSCSLGNELGCNNEDRISNSR